MFFELVFILLLVFCGSFSKEETQIEQCSKFEDTWKRDIINLETTKMLCGGTNLNFLCDNSGKEKTFSTFSTLPKGKTIRSICMNKYWGIAVDSNYFVYLWGETSSIPIQINLPGTPNKVSCTSSSLFVLNFDGSLYGMGKNENLEMPKEANSFYLLKSNVSDVIANNQNLYVILNKKNNQDIEIEMSGRLYNGTKLSKFSWRKVDTSKFPPTGYPRLSVVEQGALFSFLGNKNFYFGKQHPITNKLEEVPILIDSKMVPFKSIDFFGEMQENCFFVIENNGDENKIFFSKKDCVPESSTLDTKNNFFPRSINLGVNKIVDLKCAKKRCFFTTDESKVLLLGENWKYSQNHSEKTIKEFGNYERIIPSIDGNNILGFNANEKTTKRRKIESEAYKPRFIADQSGLFHNKLTIKFSKKYNRNELEPSIRIGNERSSDPTFCQFPGTRNSKIWNVSTSDFFNYYTISSDWNEQFQNCGWEKIISKDLQFSTFKNTVYFSQECINGFCESAGAFLKKEEYKLDIQLQVKNSLLMDVDLQMKSFNQEQSSDTKSIDVKFVIEKKLFDRSSSTGVIIFQLKTPSPYITQNIRIDKIVKGWKFVHVNIKEQPGGAECDSLYCHQQYKIEYVLSQTECNPSSQFEIIGDIGCYTDYNSGRRSIKSLDYRRLFNGFGKCSFCSSGFSAIANILVEDTCVQLTETIGLDGFMRVYKDNTYQTEKFRFAVGSIGWFVINVEVKDAKSKIDSAVIEDIVIGDHFLFKDFAKTYKGKDAELEIDNLQEPETVGFHFVFFQNFINLLMGQSKTIKISTKIRVTYNTKSKRRKEKIYMSTTEGIIEGISKNSRTDVSITLLMDGTEPIKNYTTTFLIVGITFAIGSIVVACFFAIFFCALCVLRTKNSNITPGGKKNDKTVK